MQDGDRTTYLHATIGNNPKIRSFGPKAKAIIKVKVRSAARGMSIYSNNSHFGESLTFIGFEGVLAKSKVSGIGKNAASERSNSS